MLTRPEVIPHHFGPVIDGNRDAPEPLIREKPDDLFEDGLAAHGQHRFRHSLRQWTQPRAKPARHQHDAGVIGRDPEKIAHCRQIDDAPRGVEDRHMLKFALTDQTTGFRIGCAFRHRGGRTVHHLLHRPIQIDAAQDAAPDITVGNGGHKLAVTIHNQRNLSLGPIDCLDGRSQACVGSYAERFQIIRLHGAHPVAKARAGPARVLPLRRCRPVRS